MALSINLEAFQSLKVRDFRLYWTGNTLSRFGTEMQSLALAWQIYLLTGEPLSLGLIGLVKAGPVIVFSVVGGALADAMSRQKLLMFTQAVLLGISAVLALLTFSNSASIWLLYSLIFLEAVVTSADGPAHAALIPSLVPTSLITNAITLNNLSSSMAGIVGPALSGIIIAWLGIGTTYIINAVSFMAVVLALLKMRTRLPAPTLTTEERTLAGNLIRIRKGFAFLRRGNIILNLMLLDFFAVLFGASLTLLPVFAKDILKSGPEGLGILAASPAVGAVVGAVGLTVFRRPFWPGRVVLGAIGIYGAGVFFFGLSQIFWFSCLMLALTGAADTISMTMRQSIRQLLTPDELRGRIGGVHILFASSGTQLGEFEAGLTAQLIGAQAAVAIGGAACVVVVLLINLKNKNIRNFQEETVLSKPGIPK